MYQINLFYGYEEGECGIYHAFEAADPDAEINEDAMEKRLAEMLQVEPQDDSFNWDSMYIALPDSVVERIKNDAIMQFRAGKEEGKKMEQTIKEAICEFVENNYGEEPEDACYNIEELSKAVASALSEVDSYKDKCLALLQRRFKNASETFPDEQDFYQELLDDGFTVSDVMAAMGKETAGVMLQFCEEQGMLQEKWKEKEKKMSKNALDGLRIPCPNCGAEIAISYNSARCDTCGWTAADADLEETLGVPEGLTIERFAQMYKSLKGDVGQIEDIVEMWGAESCNRGYDIFDVDSTGCLEIEAIGDVAAFDDETAVRRAIEDGIKVIPVEELPENFEGRYLGWIDTQENRLAIEKYCQRKEDGSLIAFGS